MTEESPRRIANDSARSAYIHVPFCAHRCGYCDFTLVARRDDLVEPYLQALEIDLRRLEFPRPVDTLFFGGGTPTQLSPAQLERLIALARHWFVLEPGGEFSIEANPSYLDDAKIAVMVAGGVNRVSLGVQSFDAGTLAILERDHRPEDVDRVVDRLRNRFDNVGIDLIFGVPGQTMASWHDSLNRAISLTPSHISTYGLTFEKGTAFWSRRSKGDIVPVSDELERAMYAAAMDRLPEAGLDQYELSNFACPGFTCRHNEAYWKQVPYFGHGPGAARYDGIRREMNHRSVTTWIRRVLAGESPIAEVDELPPEGRAREAILLGLRRTAGVGRETFQAHTGFVLDELAGPEIARHVTRGSLEDDGAGIRLTREGRFLADTVMADFL